jgi:hypothetical protein
MIDRRRFASTPIDPRWLLTIVAYENWHRALYRSIHAVVPFFSPAVLVLVLVLVPVPTYIIQLSLQSISDTSNCLHDFSHLWFTMSMTHVFRAILVTRRPRRPCCAAEKHTDIKMGSKGLGSR